MKEVEQTPTTTTRPSVVMGEHGFGLGLAGFIVSFFWGVVGLILSAIAIQQSKSIGKRNAFGKAGLIIGIVMTGLQLLAITGLIVGSILFVGYCNKHQESCSSDDNSGYSHTQYPLDGSGDSDSQDQTY